MTDLVEISKMSLEEFSLRLESAKMEEIKEYERLATQAWFNQSVQVTKGKGKSTKPVYSNFTDFFDSQAIENQVRKQFEKDYVPLVETKKEKQKSKQDEIMERYQKWYGLNNNREEDENK